MAMTRLLFWLLSFAAVTGVVLSQSIQLRSVCVTNKGYSIRLECQPAKVIRISNVEYGTNSQDCPDDCCIDGFVTCVKNYTIPEPVKDSCDNSPQCILTSHTELQPISLQCNTVNYTSTFVKVHYSCIDEIITSSTTFSTTTVSPITTVSQSTPSLVSGKQLNVTTTPADQINRNPGNPRGSNESMALVIGLSVAAGVVLSAIIVIVVALITVKHRRNSMGNQSQSSSKTLASSDLENGDSPVFRNLEESYGFAVSTEQQKERLQKRNDNIKRNLSFKSGEQKNKRPAKQHRSRSKTKTEQRDKNKNNSNNKKASSSNKKRKPVSK